MQLLMSHSVLFLEHFTKFALKGEVILNQNLLDLYRHKKYF